MAFNACQFTFDGVSSYEHGLMLYNLDRSDGGGVLSPPSSIIEDRTAFKSFPIFYGIVQDRPLEFDMTFGADIKAIDKGVYFERQEMEEIAHWLTGPKGYRYLSIDQPDMDNYRYKCIITSLEYETYGGVPWVFKCHVVCDSPFAYMLPQTYTYEISSTPSHVDLYCDATCDYYPKLTISNLTGTCGSVSIVNHSDNDRTFSLGGLTPYNGGTDKRIAVDGELEVITGSGGVDNLYDGFNYNFLKLVRGHNRLELKCDQGTGRIEIQCEFPVKIGG